MAAILPLFQKSLELPNAMTIIVSRVRLVSNSDTLTLPLPADGVNNSRSTVQPRGTQDAALTITHNAGSGTVTVAGTKGDEGTLVSMHHGSINNLKHVVTGT